MRIFASGAVAVALSLGAPQVGTAAPDAPRVVTAAQVNGTWKCRDNEIKVLALGHQRLRVRFDGLHVYRANGEPMANTGEASGTARIEGDTARFKPEDAGCEIALQFTGDRMVVREDGECGFGAGVTADGTYRRVDARKPTFGED